MPPMEAMACGAALCTYDNGGCRDYAIDGRTALVAPRRDVDALAGRCRRLVEDEALRETHRPAGPGLRHDAIRLGARDGRLEPCCNLEALPKSGRCE